MSAIIALDWGSSNVRAYLIESGQIIEQRRLEKGIIVEQSYFDTFQELICNWPKELPVYMCGMIGSKNGWKEAPYSRALCSIIEMLVDMSSYAKRECWLIPGLYSQHTFLDVMRGEETYLYGLDWNGLVLLPGTHNKWVWMQGYELIYFKTFMTGELFSLLSSHGLIGSLMSQDEVTETNELSFREGIMEAQYGGGLLHRLFAVRARGVHHSSIGLRDFLSGLLIGTELLSANISSPILIIGGYSLCKRYKKGLHILFPDVKVYLEQEDVAFVRGITNIWKAKNG